MVLSSLHLQFHLSGSSSWFLMRNRSSLSWFLIIGPLIIIYQHGIFALVSSRITWFLTMVSQDASTKTIFSHNSHKNLICFILSCTFVEFEQFIGPLDHHI